MRIANFIWSPLYVAYLALLAFAVTKGISSNELLAFAGLGALLGCIYLIGARLHKIRNSAWREREALWQIAFPKTRLDWIPVAFVFTALLAVIGSLSSATHSNTGQATSLPSGSIILITTIFAALAALLTQHFVIRSNILTKSRQEWVNSLRDKTSLFLTAILQIQTINSMTAISAEKKEELLADSFARLYEGLHTVKLLINPHETDHADFINALEGMVGTGFTNVPALQHTIQETRNAAIDVTARLQIILKREWERVKSLE